MRSKEVIVLKDLSERECLFHESEQKAKAGKGYFENVSTQVSGGSRAGLPGLEHWSDFQS